MTLRHHIHTRLAFRAALLGSALLLAATTAGLAEGPGAIDPDQAIVFDGSTAAQDIFVLSMKNAGYVIERSSSGFVCPESIHVSPGGLFAFGNAGVFTLEHEIGHILLLPVPRVPGTIPPELQELETDCDLLAVLPALEDYAASANSLAQARLNEAQSCRDRARNLYCAVVATIEDATILDGFLGAGVIPSAPDTPYDWTFVGPEPCTQGVTRLDEIPASLDFLATLVSVCRGYETELATLHADVLIAVQSHGGLTGADAEQFMANADALLGNAESKVRQVEETVDELSESLVAWDEASLEASCDACPPDPIGGSQLLHTGLVQLIQRRQVVGRFVGAFQSAANHTDDPELAARFADLATRLAAVPNDRVLQVLFPSSSAVGQHMLAVRPPELPDDGESPLVVVLTAVEPGEGTPALNAADIQLLFEQIRLFEATLAREPDRSETPD
jgi:hypothetical protein